ncbi:hypothetical protein R5R35_002564 [Gryllus longicercus]|uniref:NADH:ubiquinone oxidoreductase intermediate-associated protein 30 domain-containing protein n=1 Tax=Gryllus longicercus TaxID=2509291 RepID=A0AAN9YYW1_9ORTH
MFLCQIKHGLCPHVTRLYRQGILACSDHFKNRQFCGDKEPLISSVGSMSFVSRRFFYSSNNCWFWEKDIKSGYGSKEKHSRIQMIRDGLQELRNEIGLWKDEITEKLHCDPIVCYRPGEVDVMWKFDNPESLSRWVATSDCDHGEGFSNCNLSITSGKKCLFSGTLNTTVPKDGRIKKAGYCNMCCHRARKSFKREAYFEWNQYTHIVLRVRGDGRSYLLNLATSGYYDIMWNDVFHYVLFTRGGPYWQITKIPFSKFFLGSKGRVQDKQYPIPLNRITSLGISVGDGINGPFNLEIDYIGLEFDPTHQEKFAYEMYRTDNFIAGY